MKMHQKREEEENMVCSMLCVSKCQSLHVMNKRRSGNQGIMELHHN